MDQRGAVTEQLADVIRIAQLVHKTGTLIVERAGESGELEEGKITFVEGRVVEATAGHLRGTCRFVFVPSPPPTTDALVPPPVHGLVRNTDRLAPSPTPAPTGSAPYRLREANDVLPLFGAMGLTRAHRQLFLLIDGQRSVSDLRRLSVRGAEEVRKLLADLEDAGLIWLPM
jgi:hypothetical protein